MPARNRTPIQISRVSLACLALLVAVCGGYFALVPFLKAIEPSPSTGEAAQVLGSSVTVPVRVTVNVERRPTLVANQLRPKTHKVSRPKKPATKKKHATTTVPTRPVLVTNPVRTRSSTATHTSAPTHTQTTPPRSTPKEPTAPAPSRSRKPVIGITSRQGSGLAGRGSGSDATVTGGVSSTPGH